MFNPDNETKELKITTSNTKEIHRNSFKISATIGQFQCLQFEQIFNPKSGKLDHKVKFVGNSVFEKSYDENEVFTGMLIVHVSDPWNAPAGKCSVRKFILYKLFITRYWIDKLLKTTNKY